MQTITISVPKGVATRLAQADHPNPHPQMEVWSFLIVRERSWAEQGGSWWGHWSVVTVMILGMWQTLNIPAKPCLKQGYLLLAFHLIQPSTMTVQLWMPCITSLRHMRRPHQYYSHLSSMPLSHCTARHAARWRAGSTQTWHWCQASLIPQMTNWLQSVIKIRRLLLAHLHGNQAFKSHLLYQALQHLTCPCCVWRNTYWCVQVGIYHFQHVLSVVGMKWLSVILKNQGVITKHRRPPMRSWSRIL